MGINRFFQLLKKFNTSIEDITYEIPLSSFKGSKIAIDASNISYILMYKAQKNTIKNTNFLLNDLNRKEVLNYWISLWKNLVRNLLNNDIIPICVFDNKSSLMKLEKQKERRAVKIENLKKINNLRQSLYNKDNESYDDVVENIEKINEYQKLIKNQVYIKPSDIDIIKNILEEIGIPILYSPENIEAEFYCSWLTIEGHTIATFSTDTDCYACGCPLIITEIKDTYSEQLVKVICINTILQILQLNYNQFLDMCILSGTDFNKNIPNIGIVKSYNYIKKYNNIETVLNNIKANEIDIDNLNYSIMREMYKYRDTLIDKNLLNLNKSKDEQFYEIIENVSSNFNNITINRDPSAIFFKIQ